MWCPVSAVELDCIDSLSLPPYFLLLCLFIVCCCFYCLWVFVLGHCFCNEKSCALSCLFVCFVALRPESISMVMAGRSVHLTALFPGQA